MKGSTKGARPAGSGVASGAGSRALLGGRGRLGHGDRGGAGRCGRPGAASTPEGEEGQGERRQRQAQGKGRRAARGRHVSISARSGPRGRRARPPQVSTTVSSDGSSRPGGCIHAARSDQPRSSSPMAAIQLPATRTAMRPHGARIATTSAAAERDDHEQSRHDADDAEGPELRLRHCRAVQVAVKKADDDSESGHPLRPQSCLGGDEAAEGEEGRGREDGGVADRREGESHEAAHEPGAGQGEEREPPRAGASLAGEEREGERRQEVLRSEREVRHPVVEGPEARVHEVGVRGRRQQQEPRHGERPTEKRARHANARQRKYAPAEATKAPAARSATRPQPQRWMTPMSSSLHVSALPPGGSACAGWSSRPRACRPRSRGSAPRSAASAPPGPGTSARAG